MRKPSSSRIGTFSSTALACLLPGESPTTTKEVFFDTELADLPPRLAMAAAASSRLNPSSDPVTTTDRPASGFGPVSGARSSAIRTPAACHFATMLRCQSTVNHSRTASAMVRPMPSTAASCSTDAEAMASIEPNSRARSCAAVGPTCRMDSATSTRHSGRVLAASRLSSSLCAFAVRPPPLRVKKSDRSRSSAVSENRSPSSVTRPALSNATAALPPSTSMSKAPRPATWNSRSRSWAGQDRAFGQRMSASPSFSGFSSVPHSGQCVGITNSRSLPSRRSTTGPRISGITSPALRSTTVSPISTPLRTTSLALCRVARPTVEPATNTGSITPNGVTRPVRPTFTRMSSSLVFTSSGGYL